MVPVLDIRSAIPITFLYTLTDGQTIGSDQRQLGHGLVLPAGQLLPQVDLLIVLAAPSSAALLDDYDCPQHNIGSSAASASTNIHKGYNDDNTAAEQRRSDAVGTVRRNWMDRANGVQCACYLQCWESVLFSMRVRGENYGRKGCCMLLSA
jgi:hypothetical protein